MVKNWKKSIRKKKIGCCVTEMYSYQNKKNIHNYYSPHSLIVHMVVAMIYKYVLAFLSPYLFLVVSKQLGWSYFPPW